MKITRDMILKPEHMPGMAEDALVLVENLAHRLLLGAGNATLVWEFYEAPELFRVLCTWNGGDEDWLFLRGEPYGDVIPPWLDRLDYDVYLLDKGITIYVTSHS